ncbi:MAG: alpha/beta hydrolase [Rickettsiaceae bacterium]|nr:alpha/beta hydrolase [Rickettsiaceae bacterium]
MNIIEAKLETGDGTIAYLDSNTAGPALICLHGNTSCKEVFVNQFDELSKKYRVIAPDLPGFGNSFRSNTPENAYQLCNMSSTIKEFLLKLQIKNAFFFGWSLGGHIAIELLKIPNLIKKLVIFGTPPLPLDNPAQAFNIPEDFSEFLNKLSYTKSEAKMFLSGSSGPAMCSDEILINAVIIADGEARRTVIKSLLSGEYNQAQIIAETDIPVMVMIGNNDPVINNTYNDLIKLKFKKQYKAFNSLHDGFFEYPQKFNSILVQFFS